MQEQNKQELSFVKYFLINHADELKKKKKKKIQRTPNLESGDRCDVVS